jgi:hypothetical protein
MFKRYKIFILILADISFLADSIRILGMSFMSTSISKVLITFCLVFYQTMSYQKLKDTINCTDLIFLSISKNANNFKDYAKMITVKKKYY